MFVPENIHGHWLGGFGGHSQSQGTRSVVVVVVDE
jgi:hypothetical protein